MKFTVKVPPKKSSKWKQSAYLVTKKPGISYNGKKYYFGEVVRMPAWIAEMYYWSGCITDDLKIVNNKIVHPLDKRYQTVADGN